jgi:hypothetical protein
MYKIRYSLWRGVQAPPAKFPKRRQSDLKQVQSMIYDNDPNPGVGAITDIGKSFRPVEGEKRSVLSRKLYGRGAGPASREWAGAALALPASRGASDAASEITAAPIAGQSETGDDETCVIWIARGGGGAAGGAGRLEQDAFRLNRRLRLSLCFDA